ncbi:hypothetical protein TVAG_390720 [Trichomonas vaginalis G3]|uniref:Uncharacterized protein n=1 Tax=Trichomonas vaginalis (strain ATCC PRA-98 / G3) TaxID=412133 RepID=A2FDY6_TRIV3|nr:chromo domain-like family [Trichomonas vaginalis G3]EAX96865.1 hypothetical protein TVAG_390720 [Trichomonas vaginalis G3]KAI5534783.1 chromo domain-like family [Trichomonas vaginalis G3]|eukprot:XP_001309795.1 hypothetical protein [Trichomonas vaginalis G3]
MTEPQFERVEDHQFKEGEEIYMIDPNGFDIYKAQIVKIEGTQYKIHYPEYPEDDETVENTDRILALSRINTRIFNNQEAARASKLGQNSEEENYYDEDDADNDDEDQEPDFKPNGQMPIERAQKKKRGRKSHKGRVGARPENARSNPPRVSRKSYQEEEYDDDENDEDWK